MDFHNYRAIKELGKGGMATVYLAKHKILGTKVAVKVLNKEFVNNENIRGRFIEEAKKMAQINHPNVVTVMDISVNQDKAFFIMEYLDGKTLKDALLKRKLNDNEIGSNLTQMVEAVRYIHSKGLIHRDLKPSNFIFNNDGRLKLTDFGISKDNSMQNSDYTETVTKMVMGTPMYMSPEQVRSLKGLTQASDVYSLGVILWEMVSGKRPYDMNTLSTFDLQVKIVKEPLPLTSTKWDQVIQEATAKNVDERLKDLNRFLTTDQASFIPEKKADLTTDKTINLAGDKTIITAPTDKTRNSKNSGKEPSSDIDINIIDKRYKNYEEENKINKEKGIGRFIGVSLIVVILILIGVLFFDLSSSKEENKTTSVEQVEPIMEKDVAGKDLDESSRAYQKAIKESGDFKDLVSLSNIEKIRAFLKAEDEKDWSRITYLLSNQIENYWGLKNPTYKKLYSLYHDSWSRTSKRHNRVLEIKKLRSNEYYLETLYSFVSKNENKENKLKSDLYFKFDKKEEIIEVRKFAIQDVPPLTDDELGNWQQSLMNDENYSDSQYIMKYDAFAIRRYKHWVTRDKKNLALKIEAAHDITFRNGYNFDDSTKQIGDPYSNLRYLFENYYKSINCYMIRGQEGDVGDFYWFYLIDENSGDMVITWTKPLFSPNGNKFIDFYSALAELTRGQKFEVYSKKHNKIIKETLPSTINYDYTINVEWKDDNQIILTQSIGTSEADDTEETQDILLEYKNGRWGII